MFTCFYLQVVTREPRFRVLDGVLAQKTVRLDGNRMEGKDVLQKLRFYLGRSWQIEGTYDESKLLLLESVGDGLAAASAVGLFLSKKFLSRTCAAGEDHRRTPV